MSDILHVRAEEIPPKHKDEHDGYAYVRRDLVPRNCTGNTLVSQYEIPPLKSAYPYHFHHKDEETFYILKGEGLLRTPKGEQIVRTGHVLFFPASPEGAHKLTNTSSTETLVYMDFDIIHDLDVAEYPDSGKIGVWGKGINKLYQREEDVGYYEGE